MSGHSAKCLRSVRQERPQTHTQQDRWGLDGACQVLVDAMSPRVTILNTRTEMLGDNFYNVAMCGTSERNSVNLRRHVKLS
jgi:hypothetical protein